MRHIPSFILRLRITFVFCIGLVLGLSYYAYRNINQYQESNRQIEHTNTVLSHMEKLLFEVMDAESEQRGYLLTHNKEYLETYQGSRDRTIEHFGNIRELIADHPEQLERLDSLGKYLHQRYDELDERVALDHNDPEVIKHLESDPQYKHKLIHQGQKIMQVIRTMIDEIMMDEKQLLAIRSESVGESLRTNYILLAVSSLVTLLIIISAFLGISKEFRLREQLSFDLSESVYRLKQSNKELEQFAYVASHDLQEPLRKITSFSDIISMKYSDQMDPKGKEFFNRLSSAAQRMQTLISDLLNFSRAANSDVGFSRVNVHKVIQSVLDDLSIMIEEKDAKIELKLEGAKYIKGIPIQLHQLFLNLISNSLKYQREGVSPNIIITSTVSDASKSSQPLPKGSKKLLKISIQDNGIGFDEKYLPKIFTIFQRLHAIHQYSGTGIGLALCRRIVENHLGYITATSKQGEGSTFMVYLPIGDSKSSSNGEA